ncbi:unnamed protein product [Zymoseptoria tritici ST99CH_1E4]|uniref:Oxidase ustYa n=1 Tax=Zymoseptoria tritici ST99CH_1E4 TaxID=1276532 RepID=A0A2H1GBQ9_ZYMTR|nr:unnamed protein product [Zymoseptoria tritici ST99CH_1E4]
MQSSTPKRSCEKWERDRLLDDDHHHGTSRGQPSTRHTGIIAFLTTCTLLFATLAAALAWERHQHVQRQSREVSWLPPEVARARVFEYEPIFGGPFTNESEHAWTKLIPMGKGFVHINNESELDPVPGLDTSLPHQRAMVAVFHQLHCLYITRQSYFAARAGNLDDLRPEHLSHCWDYLRQTIMCAGDTTLEWLGPPPRDVGSTGWGYQHQCKDYAAIYGWAEKNRLTDTKKIHS